MAHSDSHDAPLTRRMFLLSGIAAAAGCTLTSRLFYLQFIKSDEYTTLAEGNRIKVQLVAPPRGQLLDRIGVPLAENDENYRLFVERESRKQALESLEQLHKLLSFDEKNYETLKEAIRVGNRKPLLVEEYLDWDTVAKIEFNMPDLPATYIEEGHVRHYPFADKAAHLIGYVGRVSEKELETLDDDPLFRIPEFKIGKNGVELLYDDLLQGTAGSKQMEVNASGISIRELKNTPSISGHDTTLTIDAEMQEFCAERLGEESGSVVLMDVHHGEILALVSMPAFDPNSFSLGIKSNYWNELLANEKNPLMNKAISGQYPPGSTFKMLVGLAGLSAGVINRSTTFYCPGHYFLGNHRFNCWKPGGHGTVDVRNAIAESCDTFFYNVGERLGIERLKETCNHFGMGLPTELGLVGEKSGNIPDPEWKKRSYNIPWVKGDTINASIGQGYVLATPLQLAVMVSRLCNGGKKIMPHLRPHKKDDWEKIDIDEAHLDLIREGMFRVSNATNGTAYWNGIRDEAMAMGGKTGTAQVRRITQRGLNQNTLPWKYRHHGLFVGYAPVYNPRFAVSVVVEHGGGSGAAAPVARDVLKKVQELAAAQPYRFKG